MDSRWEINKILAGDPTEVSAIIPRSASTDFSLRNQLEDVLPYLRNDHGDTAPGLFALVPLGHIAQDPAAFPLQI